MRTSRAGTLAWVEDITSAQPALVPGSRYLRKENGMDCDNCAKLRADAQRLNDEWAAKSERLRANLAAAEFRAEGMREAHLMAFDIGWNLSYAVQGGQIRDGREMVRWFCSAYLPAFIQAIGRTNGHQMHNLPADKAVVVAKGLIRAALAAEPALSAEACKQCGGKMEGVGYDSTNGNRVVMECADCHFRKLSVTRKEWLHVKPAKPAPCGETPKRGGWWCCGADFGEHEPTCPNHGGGKEERRDDHETD